jgi:tRNA uridine 5-carboxymethylaminomethyl modification enzyme
MAGLEQARVLTGTLTLTPNEAASHGLQLKMDGVRRTAFELLSHPGIDLGRLAAIWPELGGFDRFAAEQIEIEATYAVYLARQNADIASVRRDEAVAVPADLDFDAMPGLSNEIRAKLAAVRPATLGQAERIEGMTPAALTLLLAEIRRHDGRRAA